MTKKVTLQLYHDKNKIHYSYIMTRTSYITAISWQEQVRKMQSIFNLTLQFSTWNCGNILRKLLIFHIKKEIIRLSFPVKKIFLSCWPPTHKYMTRTSYITAISWPEQVTLQLYHDQNKLHYSYIMTRTSYITAKSW
jgi:hypothetical protein